ncbi:potassium-transporting ATPase KdpC subunit [Actinocatenispora thailandica]|uniref:Potassium-transporting ATPase KdpC subunit n=1 Tax=Actinocatenispora thailandica TaxID=227318 RepID=A0A7R7I0H4_9ACTN|nr:potassium-transporting ATPase subunit C [Actinocatenispora thailandica]BCJ39273.1 potassium-transporting ATPase KdpC subunit [Actinocatenispora thailandica]
MRLPTWISQHLAAVRAVLVLTALLGVLYPLVVTGIVQLPGLRAHANGSLVRVGDSTVGSRILGQGFVDSHGNPLVQYFQSRPSAAGAAGWDPTASGASNLGPESVVDTLPNPKLVAAGKTDANARQSLLTQVCARSVAVGKLEHVSGARPYCTTGGVGAVLGVFHRHGSTGPITRVVSLDQQCPSSPFLARYHGVAVECARYGADYSHAVVIAVRGDAPAHPAVPADAVTASGSGLDPQISTAYAELQAPRVARQRRTSVANVRTLIDRYRTGRALGFMGQPGVNVLELNLALDRQYPYRQQ